MSTHARIGYINDNGKYVSCYVHYDGYPAGVGKVLMNHYPNLKLIKLVVEGGDMRSLEPFQSQIEYYNDPYWITDKVELQGEEYGYVFKEGKWHIFTEKTTTPVVADELIFAS